MAVAGRCGESSRLGLIFAGFLAVADLLVIGFFLFVAEDLRIMRFCFAGMDFAAAELVLCLTGYFFAIDRRERTARTFC